MLDKFYNHPNVIHSEWEDLVIFTYSRECQYDRIWDEVTRAARGIIFNKMTGELVARPFNKFFNLGEMLETSIQNLPDLPFSATTKVDGSLAIVYLYKDLYRIATKGSFHSEQAQWATRWLHNNVDTSKLKKGKTYLFEAIYDENKIVIEYDFEGLVLLGVIDINTGSEMPYDDLVGEASALGVRLVEQETGFNKIDELYTYCKALPPNKEGFVVTFANGLKLKIKGDSYCKIHKMLSRMTPLAFWEAWDLSLRDIPKDYLSQLPDEFRELTDTLYQQIFDIHMAPFKKANQSFIEMLELLGKDADKKTFALKAKELYPNDFSFIMDMYNSKIDQVWLKIHRHCRPTQNVLPKDINGVSRLLRIQQDL